MSAVAARWAAAESVPSAMAGPCAGVVRNHGSGPGDDPEGPPGNHARSPTGRIDARARGGAVSNRGSLVCWLPDCRAGGSADGATTTSPLRWTWQESGEARLGAGTTGWRREFDDRRPVAASTGVPAAIAPHHVRRGPAHPDRNAQFEHINAAAESATRFWPRAAGDLGRPEEEGAGRELQEWRAGMAAEGSPPAVLVHDFPSDAEGKAMPYGVYDMAREARVSVGRDHDTPAFAVASIRHWWQQMGCDAYPDATALFITADAGGSNGYRVARLEARASTVGRRDQADHPRESFSTRHQQMEQDRAPSRAEPTPAAPLLSHHGLLAKAPR